MGMGQLSGETCKKVDCIADPSYYPDSIGSKRKGGTWIEINTVQ